MTPSNRVRIQNIYLEAWELPDSERAAFVAKKCAGDSDCIRDVNSLLEAAARPSILDVPVVEAGWAPDSLLGTTIDDRFKVDKELTPSGMGKVYLAHNLQLPGRFVVIKVLPHTSKKDPDAVRRFKREVKALTLISHPNVVTVIGTNDLKDGKPYIVMEYIDGPTLRSEIPSGGMGVKRAAGLIKQIGAAVGHVHDKGILHLDLKPENIMLQLLSDSTEVVKIVDFGIAKIKDSVGATGAINTVPIGTVAYMSPEQLRDGERVTTASDVYSMAVVACEMITGNRPQQPDPASGQRRQKRVDLPMGISAEARKVIERALSFDPEKRYQSAKQFGDELAEALLRDEQNGPRDQRWPPLRKWLRVVGGVVIVALLAYAVYILLPPPPPPPLQSKGFNYWLTVQRTREGKDYQEPYKSNGDDVFDNGDKFQLSVQSLYSGYLYIFNEGQPEAGGTTFRLIHPKRAVTDGSASVGGNHTVQTDWITFRGPAGTDNFWIVWSVSPLSELESAVNEALQHPQAGLTGQNLVKVKEYLRNQDAEVNARAAKIKASQEVQVRKRSDFVLTRSEFKHR